MSPNAGGVAGSQLMKTAAHITRHGAQINFGDLTPYLTYLSNKRHKYVTMSSLRVKTIDKNVRRSMANIVLALFEFENSCGKVGRGGTESPLYCLFVVQAVATVLVKSYPANPAFHHDEIA